MLNLKRIALFMVDFSAKYYARTHFIDNVFKDALHIITACLSPTPTDHFPIVESIYPAELGRLEAVLSSGLSCQSGH